MNLKELVHKLLKRNDNAKRNAESANGGQHNVRGGIHRFASARGEAVSACRRVGLLAAALSSQRSRASDCGTGDKVRELTDDGKVYFIDPLIRLSRSAEETIEWLTGFNPATMD